MSSFINSNFDVMSVEEIMAKLNEMQVRYSVRKDTSREYLLQVLKHHMKKVQDTPASVRSIEEVVFREIHSQPRVQYSGLEGTDIKRAKESRYSVGGISKNLATTEGLRQRDVSPQNRLPQGPGLFSNPQEYRNDYSSYQKSFYSSEMEQVASSSKRMQEQDLRGDKENFGRIDFGDRTAQKKPQDHHRIYHTERKSMGYNEYVAEMVEQNRACYSDTQLLKGPIDVDYNQLLRERQRHFEPSPNRPNRPENELNFRSPVNPNNTSFTGVERFPTFGPAKEEKEKSNKKWLWGALTLVSCLIVLFYATVLLPNYLYGQRTPIVYSSPETSTSTTTIVFEPTTAKNTKSTKSAKVPKSQHQSV